MEKHGGRGGGGEGRGGGGEGKGGNGSVGDGGGKSGGKEASAHFSALSVCHVM
jgi:hypothetical protein